MCRFRPGSGPAAGERGLIRNAKKTAMQGTRIRSKFHFQWQVLTLDVPEKSQILPPSELIIYWSNEDQVFVAEPEVLAQV